MNEKIRIIPYESTFQDEVVDLIVHIQQKSTMFPLRKKSSRTCLK
ncbi:hypothetical protein ACT7DP_10290 [Bacillus paranthracis]